MSLNRKVLSGAFFVVLATLCALAPAWAAGDAGNGEKLFNSVGCTGCHGAGGGMPVAGTGAVKLAENPAVASLSDDTLAQIIATGFPPRPGTSGMPAFKSQLKPDQLADIAAYVHSVAFVDPNLQPHVLWSVLIALFAALTIGTIALLEHITPEAQYRRRG